MKDELLEKVKLYRSAKESIDRLGDTLLELDNYNSSVDVETSIHVSMYVEDEVEEKILKPLEEELHQSLVKLVMDICRKSVRTGIKVKLDRDAETYRIRGGEIELTTHEVHKLLNGDIKTYNLKSTVEPEWIVESILWGDYELYHWLLEAKERMKVSEKKKD